MRTKTLWIVSVLFFGSLGASIPAVASTDPTQLAQLTQEEQWLQEEEEWWEQERQRQKKAKRQQSQQEKQRQQKAEERRIEKLIELLDEGKELLDAKDFKGALWAYRQAAELEQDDPKIYSGMGYLYSKQQDYKNAAKAYQRAISLSPKTAAFHQALGFSLAKVGDYQGAADAYREVSQLEPKNLGALLGLGAVLFKGEDFPAAEEAYRQAIALSPKNPNAYELLGVIYLKQERYADASRELAKAQKFALGKGSSTLHYNLGVAQVNQGDVAAGVKALKRAAELEAGNEELQFQVAELLAAQGELQDALQFYEAALLIKPDWVAAQVAQGELLLAQRDYRAAEKTYQALADQYPRDPGIHYNLGLALHGQERTKAAIAALQTARRLYRKQKDRDSVSRVDAILTELEKLEALRR